MKLLSAIKSIVIVMLLVLVMGFGMVQIRNCAADEPSDNVPVEDIILNETEIVF